MERCLSDKSLMQIIISFYSIVYSSYLRSSYKIMNNTQDYELSSDITDLNTMIYN